jgi:hypothetical protein
MAMGGLGISLAGFAGLIATLDRRALSGNPIAAWRIRNIVLRGSLVTIIGFGTVCGRWSGAVGPTVSTAHQAVPRGWMRASGWTIGAAESTERKALSGSSRLWRRMIPSMRCQVRGRHWLWPVQIVGYRLWSKDRPDPVRRGGLPHGRRLCSYRACRPFFFQPYSDGLCPPRFGLAGKFGALSMLFVEEGALLLNPPCAIGTRAYTSTLGPAASAVTRPGYDSHQ